jgi:putative ABC transport system permease protein
MIAIIRRIHRGLSALLRGRETDAGITDELRHYLDQAVAEYERRGLPHAEAVRAATIDMGNVSAAREEVRSFGWEHVVETFVTDVRYALRRLRRSPGFTSTAIVTLALGIGASTTVFSVISPVLIEPLPFPHASELVTIDDRTSAGVAMPVTFGTFDELRARSRSFSAIAAADDWRPSLVGTSDPEQLRAQRVTSRYFDVYGVAPIVGRGFTAEDERQGSANVVVLSDGILRRRFGGDRSVLGKTIDLDGTPHTVIGIMPPAFANIIAPTAEVWAPLRDRVTGRLEGREWGHHYKMIARLAPGATAESAMRETTQIGARPVPAFLRPSWASLDGGLLVRAMQDDVTGPVRPSLLAILGAVVLLLAITAVNVMNLLLARGSQRRAEMAMRVALGASRGRILRQLLTESVVLAFVGGMLGLVVARVGVGALVAASPAGLPRAEAIHVSARVFAFAFALTAAVGLIVGLLPALGSVRAETSDGLHQAARPRVGRHGALRHALVVAEVALALVLLIGAGLMYRSVTRLMGVAPGFDPSHVVTMQVVVPRGAAASDSTLALFFEQAVDAVRRLPGVRSAALSSQLPLSGDVDGYGIEAQSLPDARNGDAGSALRYSVTPDYFRTMAIPLRQGRLLDGSDRPGSQNAVVINESLARRLFGNGNPIGERMHFGPQMGDDQPWSEVVGVVGDVKHYTLAAAAPDAFYVVTRQWPWVDNTQTLIVRAAGDASALVPAIKRAVWSVNPNRPIQRVRTMESFVAASAGAPRLVLHVIETFASAALILAAVGLYGVIAGHVIERMREIGIRAAMGAAPADLVRSIVTKSLALAGVGALVGLPVAFGATRLLESMLFGISRVDVATYGGVIALVIAVAALAAWAPARRAAGVDPTIALRSD